MYLNNINDFWTITPEFVLVCKTSLLQICFVAVSTFRFKWRTFFILETTDRDIPRWQTVLCVPLKSSIDKPYFLLKKRIFIPLNNAYSHASIFCVDTMNYLHFDMHVFTRFHLWQGSVNDRISPAVQWLFEGGFSYYLDKKYITVLKQMIKSWNITKGNNYLNKK